MPWGGCGTRWCQRVKSVSSSRTALSFRTVGRRGEWEDGARSEWSLGVTFQTHVGQMVARYCNCGAVTAAVQGSGVLGRSR